MVVEVPERVMPRAPHAKVTQHYLTQSTKALLEHKNLSVFPSPWLWCKNVWWMYLIVNFIVVGRDM